MLLGLLALLATTEIGRAQVTEDLDLVVRVAGQRLQVSLHNRTNASLSYKIADEDLGEDCHASVQRIASTDVLIQCAPEKGNTRFLRKFVLDARAKSLVGRVEFEAAPFHRIRRTARGYVFVGAHPHSVEHNGGKFRVLKAPRVERRTAESKLRLPQSTYDQFAAARPRRVEHGYTRDSTRIEERAGPVRRHGGVLWFGKTFYDGEGTSGVGGFGFHDTSYRIYSPPEIADWSVSAMLVEDAAVWLALASFGEWSTHAGGLLRFDRASETVRRFELPDIVADIVRDGDRLLLATDLGIAIVGGGKVRRFFLDRLTDGRLRVAEATAR